MGLFFNMSSHHIVKEKQEPALIIANGEACSQELMGQLLEWSPFVIVLDGAINRVIDLGIKIDVLFGDFDRIDFNQEEILKSQFPIEIIHAPNQDKTDLEKAIDFLIERGFPAANILWATGKRADHTMANIAILPKYLPLIKLKIIDDHSCIFPIFIGFHFCTWSNKELHFHLFKFSHTEYKLTRYYFIAKRLAYLSYTKRYFHSSSIYDIFKIQIYHKIQYSF